MEEQKLIQNLQSIDRVKKEANVEIILAYKGFAMWSAFPILLKYINGATASSLNEVRLCKEKMGVKSHTYCVAYDPMEFGEIVNSSLYLTFNSLSQYQKFVDKVPDETSIGLRVNPGWSDVKTDLYNPSDPASRLGVESLSELPERVDGLHFHVLCESDSKSLEAVLESFVNRFGHLLDKVKWVNMGGGHLMTRNGYDLDHLIQLLKEIQK